jgi:hypothetical protein
MHDYVITGPSANVQLKEVPVRLVKEGLPAPERDSFTFSSKVIKMFKKV